MVDGVMAIVWFWYGYGQGNNNDRGNIVVREVVGVVVKVIVPLVPRSSASSSDFQAV